MPRAGALASRQAESQQCAVQSQGEPQAIARAEFCTCVEHTSVLSSRTRLAPLSVAESTSMGSSRRSWRGAIATLHALADSRSYIFSGAVNAVKWRTAGSTCTSLVLRGASCRVPLKKQHTVWRCGGSHTKSIPL
eukprot:scaffold3763_cov103-Isochrysis_galbana.AAC.2